MFDYEDGHGRRILPTAARHTIYYVWLFTSKDFFFIILIPIALI
jgi:hypothetical protein